jgi:hypothetical protein
VPFHRGHSYFLLEDNYCLCYIQPLVIARYYFMCHVVIVELVFSPTWLIRDDRYHLISWSSCDLINATNIEYFMTHRASIHVFSV